MFILTISGQQTEGAYAVTDPDGERALYLFEEEDISVTEYQLTWLSNYIKLWEATNGGEDIDGTD